MHQYQLTQINIYPVKSFGGISLPSAIAGERGLQYDRRWMLVDEFNRFITQRENPLMAQIGVSLNTDCFSLFHKINPQHVLPLPFSIDSGKQCTVTIFNDSCDAITLDDELNDWLCEILHQDCRLVYMQETTKRLVDQKYSFNKEVVSFADGYPFLIIGEASLAELNTRLSIPVPMTRFRPNFVFSGGNAFDEDHWSSVTIGDADFRAAKQCGRCVITTIDQDTGEQGKEPLRTLSEFRKVNNRVLFGQNLLLVKEGIVKVNDHLVIQS